MEITHGIPGEKSPECDQPSKYEAQSIHLTGSDDGQAFNMVTQRDSQAMIQDSKSMRAIATVTVVFLPLATIAVTSPPSSAIIPKLTLQ